MNDPVVVMGTLVNAFKTAKAASSIASVPVTYEATEGSSSPRLPTSEVIRWYFRPATERAAALGRRLYRLFGLVDCQIFTPIGRGIGRGVEIANLIKGFYRDQEITGVWIRAADFDLRGSSDGMYFTQVRISFVSDETL